VGKQEVQWSTGSAATILLTMRRNCCIYMQARL
jgi:hypothetical protein